MKEGTTTLNHYKAVAEGTTQSEATQEKVKLDGKRFRRKLGTWGYAFGISLLPFILMFALVNGPRTNFCILEFFYDSSLLYLGVTMSALSLYTYGRKNLLVGIHSFIVIIGVAIYCFSTVADSIPSYTLPLFDVVDRRLFIACFLIISILLGFCTILYSSMKKEAKIESVSNL